MKEQQNGHWRTLQVNTRTAGKKVSFRDVIESERSSSRATAQKLSRSRFKVEEVRSQESPVRPHEEGHARELEVQPR
jgi:hypothetical protein